MKFHLAAAALVSTVALSGVAHASNTCSGKVIADSVYQEGSNGNFQYYVQLRNATHEPITADVSLGGFGNKVTLFSPNLPGVKIGVNSKNIEKLRFGKGSNDQIHNGTVSRLYDTKGTGSKPYVSISNCR